MNGRQRTSGNDRGEVFSDLPSRSFRTAPLRAAQRVTPYSPVEEDAPLLPDPRYPPSRPSRLPVPPSSGHPGYTRLPHCPTSVTGTWDPDGPEGSGRTTSFVSTLTPHRPGVVLALGPARPLEHTDRGNDKKETDLTTYPPLLPDREHLQVCLQYRCSISQCETVLGLMCGYQQILKRLFNLQNLIMVRDKTINTVM